MIYQRFSRARRLRTSAFILVGMLLTFNARSSDLDCNLEHLYSQKTTGILYQIKSDAKPTSYLFGTMHIGTPNFRELPITVKDAMRQSQIYLTESPTGSEALENIKLMTHLQEGKTLRTILRDDVYEKYQAWLNRTKVTKEMQEHLEGWSPLKFGYLFFRGLPETKGLDRLDEIMLDMAISQSLEIMSVENSYEWGQGLKSLTNEDWSNLFNEMLEDESCPSCKKERLFYIRCTLELVRIGKAEELFSTQQKFLSSRPGERNYYEKTSTSRNKHQANNINKLINEQVNPMFFTVGATHIVGPLGIVQRLRDMGYIVEQIKY
jgi:uncharacterized protein YbaP (TraB family)